MKLYKVTNLLYTVNWLPEVHLFESIELIEDVSR